MIRKIVYILLVGSVLFNIFLLSIELKENQITQNEKTAYEKTYKLIDESKNLLEVGDVYKAFLRMNDARYQIASFKEKFANHHIPFDNVEVELESVFFEVTNLIAEKVNGNETNRQSALNLSLRLDDILKKMPPRFNLEELKDIE